MKLAKLVPIFFPFLTTDWANQSDSLRGGISFSNLDIAKNGKSALFSGYLNTTILNAGFASQKTTGSNRFLDWSKYHGIQFEYSTPDCALADRKFTLIIKDRLSQGDDGPPGAPGVTPDPTLPPGPDTVSFQFSFRPKCDPYRPNKKYKVAPTFKQFTPEYRGRESVGTLDLKTVRRFSIMVRSFAQKEGEREQDGPFKLRVQRISLWR